MRITESRIRQIIKEEAQRVLAESNVDMGEWTCDVEQLDDNFDPRDDSDFLVTCAKGDVVVKSYWGGSFKPGKFGYKVSTDPGRQDDKVTVGGELVSEDDALKYSMDAFEAAEAALIDALKVKRKEWEADEGSIEDEEGYEGERGGYHGGDFPLMGRFRDEVDETIRRRR